MPPTRDLSSLPPPSPKIGVPGQAQKSYGAYGTLFCGAAAIQRKRLVPFYNLRTNGGGLEKRPPDPFVSKNLLEKKNQKEPEF